MDRRVRTSGLAAGISVRKDAPRNFQNIDPACYHLSRSLPRVAFEVR